MRAKRIQETLLKTFPRNSLLEIDDDSDQHSGRAGQESHFKLMLVSSDFEGKSRVQRQRLINELLKAEFQSGLHALSMRLLTPEEHSIQKQKFQTPDCQGTKQ